MPARAHASPRAGRGRQVKQPNPAAAEAVIRRIVSRWRALRPTPGNLRRRFALVAETVPPTPVDHARGPTQDYERDHNIEPEHHHLLSEPSQRAPDLWRSFGADSHAGAAEGMQARDAAAGPPLWRSDIRPATSAHVTLQATPGKPSHPRDESGGVETMRRSRGDPVKIMALRS
jgi:hypothetical protein